MRRSMFTRIKPSAPPDLRRSRWPVLLSALVLLWCSAWYCRGEGQGLLQVAAGVAALAVIRPRAVPATTRWIVWCSLAVVVACLAANVARLIPPEKALEGSRNIDRLVTVLFALGLSALFFRPSATGVTLVAAGGLPMAMVVLMRDPGVTGAVVGLEAPFVWGFVALVVAADLAQRLTQSAEEGAPTWGLGEWTKRSLWLAAVVAAAIACRVPVEWAARGVQKGLIGWMADSERNARQGAGDMRLNIPTSMDLGQRMRVILLVGTDRLPGYLRERVYLHYREGKWQPLKPDHELAVSRAESTRSVYALAGAGSSTAASAWRGEVMAPSYLSAFCMPGSAVSLAYSGAPPLAEANGTATPSERLPERYDLAVAPQRLIESAYPSPSGRADPAYLEVPSALAAEVSNWVVRCTGLAAAVSARSAVQPVEEYFAKHFEYRLGVRLKSSPDPLVDFMARREGSCTHFASAAALMFRSCGMPSRVVSGFVCSEWNPWLKRWVVRERQEHAWVEAWDDASGQWLVVDPTPPAGNPQAWKKASALRLAMDYVAAGWKRLLVYLSEANFLGVIADAGALLADFVWNVVSSVPGAVVLIGACGIAWLRHRMRRRRGTPVERLRAELAATMARLERRSAPAHLRRRPSESWDAWQRRVGPELPPETLAELRETLERYQELRYQVALDEPAIRAWLARAGESFRRGFLKLHSRGRN